MADYAKARALVLKHEGGCVNAPVDWCGKTGFSGSLDSDRALQKLMAADWLAGYEEFRRIEYSADSRQRLSLSDEIAECPAGRSLRRNFEIGSNNDPTQEGVARGWLSRT